MNFSKIFFEVNICFGKTFVSNVSQIILEEDDKINQMIEKYVQSKNFLKKNVPLVLRLLESKYKNLSKDGINIIVRQLNINFKKEQINSKDHLDKENCIIDFNKYIFAEYHTILNEFSELIVTKVKNDILVEINTAYNSSRLSKVHINELLDLFKKNQIDIIYRNESLLEIYMDFLSPFNLLKFLVCNYQFYRCLVIPIIEVKEKMLNSEVYKNKSVLNLSEFDEIYSYEFKNSLCQKLVYYSGIKVDMLKKITDNEKLKKFLDEFSEYVVEMNILIEKHNYFNNKSLTRFTINSYIFKYLDNNNDDDLKKEIRQLNKKLSNFLFIESEKYDTDLSYYVKRFYYLRLKEYNPFFYHKNNDSVLGNYVHVEKVPDIYWCYKHNFSDHISREYEIISLILINPLLTRYLVEF
ncbi:hypothetical protein HERIO_797 [Hepatospora eriocheir]|uniref:Uncharacterized protein n=1 Tax=Hepatospora eriocheir TaxID=1081669 RepID=A0A1X0QC18_9MICR|nr:hypothetical protein HERIO_797 [Hepatospora eriocheir]